MVLKRFGCSLQWTPAGYSLRATVKNLFLGLSGFVYDQHSVLYRDLSKFRECCFISNFDDLNSVLFVCILKLLTLMSSKTLNPTVKYCKSYCQVRF